MDRLAANARGIRHTFVELTMLNLYLFLRQQKPLMGLTEVMPRLWEMRLAALLCRYLNASRGSLEHGCEGFRIQLLT